MKYTRGPLPYLPIGVYSELCSTLLNDDNLARNGILVFIDANSSDLPHNIVEKHRISGLIEAKQIAQEQLTCKLKIIYHPSFENAKALLVCLCRP